MALASVQVSSPLKVRNPVQAADAAAMRIATPEDVAGAPVLLQPARAGRQLRTRSLIRPGAAQVSVHAPACPGTCDSTTGSPLPAVLSCVCHACRRPCSCMACKWAVHVAGESERRPCPSGGQQSGRGHQQQHQQRAPPHKAAPVLRRAAFTFALDMQDAISRTTRLPQCRLSPVQQHCDLPGCAGRSVAGPHRALHLSSTHPVGF